MLGSVGSGSSLYRKFFSKPCDVLRKVRPLAVRLHMKLIFCDLFARGMGIGGAQERLAALGHRGAPSRGHIDQCPDVGDDRGPFGFEQFRPLVNKRL